MKRTILSIFIAGAVFVCACMCTGAAGGGNAPRFGAISMPAWSPDGGKVAFVYTMGGESEVYIVKADGTEVKNVSKDAALDTNPVWSPDGNTLLFMSRRGGQFDIYRVDVKNGGKQVTAPQPITRSPSDDMWPTWSPDGGKIAFCNYDTGYPLVYTSGAQGGAGELFYEERACFPAYSADGKMMALSSGGDLLIFKLEDNTAPGEAKKELKKKNITESLIEGEMVDDTLPVWAPRGNTLAFIGRYEAYSAEIYTISSSGKKIRRITDNLFEDLYPRWSPDGKGVVYSAFVDGRPPEIFVSTPDSPEKVRLTDNHVIELLPVFSPDGENILYVRRTNQQDELYIMDKEGGNQRPFLTAKEKAKLPTVKGNWAKKQEERKK